jgi:exopolysaccharide biosynthesis polyprenyl glycosylphosphotransferase
MLREHAKSLVAVSRGLDLACIAVAFLAASYPPDGVRDFGLLFSWLRGSRPRPVSTLPAEHLLFLCLALLTWIGAGQYMGVYRSHRADSISLMLRSQFRAQLLWLVALGFLVFVLKLGVFSRALFLYFYICASVLLASRQTVVLSLLRRLRRHGYNLRRAVILGDPERARRFAGYVRQKKEAGFRLIESGALQFSRTDHVGPGSNGKLHQDFDEAFIVVSAPPPIELEALALHLLQQGKRVHIVPGVFDATLFRQTLDEFAGIPVLSIGGQGNDALGTAVKRVVDAAGALGLIAMLSPLLGLIALAVKLTSSGPVFFAQERLGKDGGRFRLYKFRTMCSNAEEILKADPALHKKYVENNYKLPKDQDRRITSLGHFLRKSSLDELPQLFNVLRGDMSLVGPRPIVPSEIEKYSDYAQLFVSVKPGLTGYWQVNGRSEIGDYGTRAALDLEYVRDRSLKTDVAILLKTIPAVLRGRGAH